MKTPRPSIPGKISRLEVAARLGYSSITSIARAHANGTLTIPYATIGGRTWYDAVDVDRFIASRHRTPAPAHARRRATVLTVANAG